MDRLGGDGAHPRNIAFLDLCVPDGKSSRLSQLNPKNLVMLSPTGNPLLSIKEPHG